MKQIFLSLFLAAAAFGQELPAPSAILPPGEDLRRFLSLSDTQMRALQDIQREQQSENEKIYQEMRQKSQELDALYRSNSRDYVTIGRLNVELRTLSSKLPVRGEPYRTRSLNVLTVAQKAKLPLLSDALKLQMAAYLAVQFNLIDRPDPGEVHILPAVTENP